MKKVFELLFNTSGGKNSLPGASSVFGPALATLALITIVSLAFPISAYAREIRYQGEEVTVYVKPGEPTQLEFPSMVQGGFRRENSSVLLERQEKYLVVFAQPQIAEEGEVVIVHLDDTRSYSIRLKPAEGENQRDGSIQIIDNRAPPVPDGGDEVDPTEEPKTQGKYAPPSKVAGFMRQLILVAEFGKRKPIPGYRKSNRYSGEVVLHDGAIEATIDEIYIGSNYWGYVISVENKLDTVQQINPATFRLDGTRAVSMSRPQLAPKPLTVEQNIAGAHKAKVYVITKAKRL